MIAARPILNEATCLSDRRARCRRRHGLPTRRACPPPRPSARPSAATPRRRRGMRPALARGCGPCYARGFPPGPEPARLLDAIHDAFHPMRPRAMSPRPLGLRAIARRTVTSAAAGCGLLAIAACQTVSLPGSGGGYDGNWASSDGIFVASFAQGAFTSRSVQRPDLVLAQGTTTPTGAGRDPARLVQRLAERRPLGHLPAGQPRHARLHAEPGHALPARAPGPRLIGATRAPRTAWGGESSPPG